MMLIAAGVRIAKQKGEIDKVRKEPKDLNEFRPEKLKAAYDAYSSSEDSDESNSDEDAKHDQPDDEWEDVQLSRQDKRTQERKK
jgi:hypothetical protein